MKKTAMFSLAILLTLSLCACSPAGSSNTYTVTRNGTDYTVDQENGTISDGLNTYQFTFSGNASGYDIKITYPNGSTYSWHTQTSSSGTGFGSGGWSDDYDADRYVSGDELCDLLLAGAPKAPRNSSPEKFLIVLLLLALGGFNIASPQTAWYLSEGWKFRDAEPSQLALGLTRAGGAACCVVAVIVIFAW